MDRCDAARELMAIFLETESLPTPDQLIARIEKVGTLQNKAHPLLRPITRQESVELAQGSMPRALALHRFRRAESLCVWISAHRRLYPDASTDWLEDLFTIFEWSRSACEEGGELGCEWIFAVEHFEGRPKLIRDPIELSRSSFF